MMINETKSVLGVLGCYLKLDNTHKNKILSLYINTDFRDADNHDAPPRWQVDLSAEIESLRVEFGDEAIQHMDCSLTWLKVEERLVEQVMQIRPQGRAIAIFTDFIDDLFIELSNPVQTEAHFGIPEIATVLTSSCIRQISHYPFL